MRSQAHSQSDLTARKPHPKREMRQAFFVLWLMIAMFAAQLPAARGAQLPRAGSCGDKVAASDAPSLERSSDFESGTNEDCCCDLDSEVATGGCPMGTTEAPISLRPAPLGCDCNFSPESEPETPPLDCYPGGSFASEHLAQLLNAQQHIAFSTVTPVHQSTRPRSLCGPPRLRIRPAATAPQNSVLATRLMQAGTAGHLASLSSLQI